MLYTGMIELSLNECVLFLNTGLVNDFMCNAFNTVGNKLKSGVIVWFRRFTENTFKNCSMFKRYTDSVYRSGNVISTEPITKYLVIGIK